MPAKRIWSELQTTASEDKSSKTLVGEGLESAQTPPLIHPAAAAPADEVANPGDNDGDQEVWMYEETDSWQMFDEQANAVLVAAKGKKYVTV